MIAQLATAFLLLFAVTGCGLAGSTRARRHVTLPLSTTLALVPLLGLTAIGVATLVVGHLGLLGPWLPVALAIAGGLALALTWRPAVAAAGEAWRAGVTILRESPLLMGATLFALALAAVSALAPPLRTDEVEYHWPAAVAWAEAGQWNDSPYRHVDGFPLMEVIYTAAATQGSWVAAHLLHLTTLVALGLGAAGVARAVGLTGTAPVAAAAMAMPVVWDGAYVAYNDTAVGAFSTVAVAVLLGGRATTPALWVASGLLVAATSIKPSAVAGTGVLGLMLLLLTISRSPAGASGLRGLIRGWLVLGVPAALTLVFWSARQWFFTGHWIDPVASAPPDEIALTMLPTPLEQALAPLLPFVSGIVGAAEPWGGRTSLVVQVFLVPAIVWVLWRRGEVARRFVLLAAPAWAHWVVLGLAIVRTRFHLVSWALLVVAVRVAVEDAASLRPGIGRWLERAWTLLVLLGLLDVSLEMVRLIRDHVI